MSSAKSFFDAPAVVFAYLLSSLLQVAFLLRLLRHWLHLVLYAMHVELV